MKTEEARQQNIKQMTTIGGLLSQHYKRVIISSASSEGNNCSQHHLRQSQFTSAQLNRSM